MRMKGERILLILLVQFFLLSSCSSFEENHEENDRVITTMKKDSIHYEYYDNEVVKSKSTYREGKRNGLYESYWRNGNVYARVTYEEGIRKGFYENFDSIGQKIVRRVEYIKKTEIDSNKDWLDYANRIWDYIDGDTTLVSTSSSVYNVYVDSLNTEIEFLCTFNREKPKDGVYEKVSLVIGNVMKPDTSIDMAGYEGRKHVNSAKYSFSKQDFVKGYLQGAIIADDYYEKKGEQYTHSRILFFRWNIKEGKLENHLIGN